MTVALALPELADTSVGEPGTGSGVIAVEADEGRPVPTALMAETVKV